jgi:hypothetical protein
MYDPARDIFTASDEAAAAPGEQGEGVDCSHNMTAAQDLAKMNPPGPQQEVVVSQSLLADGHSTGAALKVNFPTGLFAYIRITLANENPRRAYLKV